MKLNTKKVGIGLAGLALLCGGVLYFLQNRIERISTQFLTNKLPPHIQVEYEDLDVNILSGSLNLKMIKADFFDPVSLEHRNALVLDELRMQGLDYWNYFFNDIIAWDNAILIKPHFVYYKKNSGDGGEIRKGEDGTMNTNVLIDEIRIENGSFALVSEGRPRPVITFQNVEASLHDFKANKQTTNEKIPFKYEQLTFSANDFHTELGEYELLNIGELRFREKNLEADSFSIKTRLSKKELSKQIKTERDHTTLEIEKIVVWEPAVFFKDTVMQLNADSILIQRPVAEIYRDKLVPDNQVYRPMYSQMLRELPFSMDISQVSINDGELQYEERIKQGSGPGTLNFKDLNASILHLSNTYEPPLKTEIQVTALFMGDSPLDLDWNFDINEPDELFTVSGTISEFDAPSINPFLESTMNYRVEGFVHKLYFTSSGNKVKASGDLEMNYRDFDLIVMKQDGSGVNKLLTVIGDIVVKENKDNSDPGFRYGKIEAERDPTKSFFNYLWLNIRSGIKSSVTGDGKKD